MKEKTIRKKLISWAKHRKQDTQNLIYIKGIWDSRLRDSNNRYTHRPYVQTAKRITTSCVKDDSCFTGRWSDACLQRQWRHQRFLEMGDDKHPIS